MLKFSGIQPVQFGAKDCTPEINAETRLRIERAGFETQESTKKAEEILASCFPEDEAYVLEFIRTKMTTTDKQILKAYLTGGDRAVALFEDAVRDAIKNSVDKTKAEG